MAATDGSIGLTRPDAAVETVAPAAPVVAMLLAQLGAHASRRLTERVGELSLSPADAAVLRLVAFAPGLSQRAVADRLGLQASRLVALVDALEARGLVERTRSSVDRRVHELRLAPGGRSLYGRLADLLAAHEAELTASLTPDEHALLVALLGRLTSAAGLTSAPSAAYRLL